MNRTTWRIPLLLLCLGVGIIVFAGPPTGHAKTFTSQLDPIPLQLEELIERALLGNPEILLKDAELRESIAALNQARLAVTQQVVRLHFLRREQREVVRAQKDKLNERRAEQKSGITTMATVRDATIELAQAEGALARTEADLRYAIGVDGTQSRGTDARALDILMVPRTGSRESLPDQEEPVVAPKPVPPEFKAILQKKFTFEFDDLPVTEGMDFLAQLSGVTFLIPPELSEELQDMQISLSFQRELSLEHALRAIADVTELQFVFRDYGFLIQWKHDDPEEGAWILR